VKKLLWVLPVLAGTFLATAPVASATPAPTAQINAESVVQSQSFWGRGYGASASLAIAQATQNAHQKASSAGYFSCTLTSSSAFPSGLGYQADAQVFCTS